MGGWTLVSEDRLILVGVVCFDTGAALERSKLGQSTQPADRFREFPKALKDAAGTSLDCCAYVKSYHYPTYLRWIVVGPNPEGEHDDLKPRPPRRMIIYPWTLSQLLGAPLVSLVERIHASFPPDLGAPYAIHDHELCRSAGAP